MTTAWDLALGPDQTVHSVIKLDGEVLIITGMRPAVFDNAGRLVDSGLDVVAGDTDPTAADDDEGDEE